jgi:hypothetical protein
VTVQLDQASAAAGVRQRHLDRQVDPAGPRGERGLQQVGTVAGEQEDDVGVVAEPVHLVEQLEQQRGAAWLLAVPLLGDQVDVLENHHRRLQQPCHRARPRDQPDLATGQQYHRAVAHASGQVHGREGLAGARLPVEEQAAAQVAARRQHPVAVRGEGDSVSLDPFEHAVGKHDVLTGDAGERVEV